MNNQDFTRGTDTRTVQRNVSAAEVYEQHKHLFNAVTSRYARARQSSPVVACQIDPAPVTRSNKLSTEDIHFASDVERITERALGTRLDLQAAWFSLVLGEHVPQKIAREVIAVCARAYRPVDPRFYFASNRYAHRKAR